MEALRAPRGRSTCAALVASVLVLAFLAPPAFADLAEFQLGAGSAPARIASGPDGALWFTDSGLDKIGHITTAGALSPPLGGLTAASTATGIVSASNGNVWFTELTNNAIGRVTPAGVVTEFSLAALGASRGAFEIALGPAGVLYFTERTAGRIGAINPLAGSDGAILASETQSATVPSGAGAQPSAITLGSDGNIWFTEAGASRVGDVSPTLSTINEFSSGITAGSAPTGIAPGPDGALWFTEKARGGIGRITTAGSATEFPVPTPSSQPTAITQGADGAMWFTESRADQIGRIDPTSHVVTEIQLLRVSDPEGIVSGPDKAVWFTEQGPDRIGRLPTNPQNLALPAIAGMGSPGLTLSCSPGTWGNAPTGFAYQWNRDGTAIAGATAASYTTVAADTDHALTCTVTATNAAGSSTPATSAPLKITVLAVTVSKETISPSAFPAKPSGPSALAAKKRRYGAKVTYALNVAASVRFTVQRRSDGRTVKHGKKTTCDRPTKRNRNNRNCTRYTTLKGSFIRVGLVGSNAFRFTGRLNNKRLPRGKYRLIAGPTANATTGRAATANFRIIR